jgi:hypothetical protein
MGRQQPFDGALQTVPALVHTLSSASSPAVVSKPTGRIDFYFFVHTLPVIMHTTRTHCCISERRNFGE